MKKTPTGDYQFSFGMEFHQFWPDRDDCLLGTLIITVTDFGATMRGTKAEGDFFALKDTKMFHDYVKLFGETEGVKADRKRMTR
jgi:hypothetical protein